MICNKHLLEDCPYCTPDLAKHTAEFTGLQIKECRARFLRSKSCPGCAKRLVLKRNYGPNGDVYRCTTCSHQITQTEVSEHDLKVHEVNVTVPPTPITKQRPYMIDMSSNPAQVAVVLRDPMGGERALFVRDILEMVFVKLPEDDTSLNEVITTTLQSQPGRKKLADNVEDNKELLERLRRNPANEGNAMDRYRDLYPEAEVSVKKFVHKVFPVSPDDINRAYRERAIKKLRAAHETADPSEKFEHGTDKLPTPWK